MRKRRIHFHFWLTLLVGLLVIPTILMLLWSVANWWPWPDLLPKEVGLRGYRAYIKTRGNLKVLVQSLALSFVATLITLLISMPAAKAMGQMNFKGKKLVDMIIMLPLIAPTVSIATGIHILFIKAGLANTFLGVVVIHIFPCLPYGIRILQSAYHAMGDSLQLQARNLGSTGIKTFLFITIPMLSPALVSAFGMIFIISYSQYLLTLLIGGGRILTLTIQMIPFLQSGDRIMGSTYSVVFMLSSLVILLLVERAVAKFYPSDRIYYY